MKKALKIILGLCVIALLGAVGLVGTDLLLAQSEDAQEGGGESREATRVGVVSPETRDIDDAVSVIGSLMPVRAVDLVPYATGRVTEVAVISGQQVAEGDLIVQLDDSAPRAALAEAEATLSETRQELARIEELNDRNTAAEASLEEARAAFVRAQAAVEAARADIEDRRVTAPFAGTVGLVDIEEGAFLDTSSPVARLVDLSSVELDAALPEQYFDRVRPGLSVSITVPAYPDERFEGEVAVRAPEIDPASRTFPVRAVFENDARRLAGGMFADARLVFGTYEGLAIADDAIISEGLTTYVYTVTDGTAQRTDVVAGASLGALTEVEGLDAGAQVVVTGWDQLSDGAPVEIDETVPREALE
ncbi:efflux RND transporter periplasmic adaptor subunit [Roseivivax isoporae]|uniref:Uncharacterized protein n=1 Tax=Roseivivax isoporae LMG 25204 TaxID=1449351 RepID=X7F336_9RHOB|nr:efflux RND transporter periplasmic adaptor subunit [Roseivivax isoporae]ETX27215.1 hypothetical protein RISW2_15255 [Roseivivax isoporae LMG 25204]